MVSCIYIDTRRYGISLLMINSISHSFAVFTRELSSWTLEEKFLVYACLCRYKRVTYLWNLIRSMIEVVSKNGDKNHHDELHSALKIAVKRRKTMNTHITSSWLCFFGGGFRYCWFAKGSQHLGKYSTQLLNDKWLCLVVWHMMTIISWCFSFFFVSW